MLSWISSSRIFFFLTSPHLSHYFVTNSIVMLKTLIVCLSFYLYFFFSLECRNDVIFIFITSNLEQHLVES